MNDKTEFSEEKFNEIIDDINQDNWILANIAKLVYYAGFHKNEIENIKIKNVLQNETVVSGIEPFLSKTKKAYSSMPIILNDESRNIIESHIKQLKNNEYNINANSPLFPDTKTKEQYVPRTLTRHFEKYFGEISFNDLRAYANQRKKNN